MVITTSTNLVLSLNGIECAEMMARALLEIRKQKKILELCQQRMRTEGNEGAVLRSQAWGYYFKQVSYGEFLMFCVGPLQGVDPCDIEKGDHGLDIASSWTRFALKEIEDGNHTEDFGKGEKMKRKRMSHCLQWTVVANTIKRMIEVPESENWL